MIKRDLIVGEDVVAFYHKEMKDWKESGEYLVKVQCHAIEIEDEEWISLKNPEVKGNKGE